ncbi:MAG: family 1 encapsulin nanocompartment shell protein, partial [Povalibacter sp.]
TSRGYPIIDHVRKLLDGPIVWAPAADGAVVMSMRGGDFELSVGQDFSIGYLDHTGTSVLLYLQESFTFRVLSPEAAVPLTYSKQG